MSTAWRKAGFSFNKYLQISAQTVRNSLKSEFQTAQVQSRSRSEAKVFKYVDGVAQEPVPLKK